MARFKPIDISPKLIPVDFAQQILPGSFEYALCHLIDGEVDLSELEARYRNEETGAPAYAPALLLKIVLLAYSRGIVSARAIEAACRQNVLFMAVSGDAAPNFTTIAALVSELGEAIGTIFTQVLMVCDRQRLIGRELFAIDAVKLPANAAKQKSGTRKDFQREARKMERAVSAMLQRHRSEDAAGGVEPSLREREAQQIERRGQEAAQGRRWLKAHPKDRPGARRAIRKSNLTDNESAKMATAKGVIQGYTGVAAVDERHQIIVEAQAHGVGQEQGLLVPVVDALEGLRTAETVISADSGYHSEDNLEQLAKRQLDAFISDHGYRKRDPRYAGQEAHKAKPDALHDKTERSEKKALFGPAAFRPAKDLSHCLCPAGRRLYRNGHHHDLNGFEAVKFTGPRAACGPCKLRTQCLRHPQRTPVRQVAIFLGRTPGKPERLTDLMKRKIDTALGRQMITRRFATVEPVFANLRHNKGLDRFTLRGTRKVDGQWKLYCLVHNIEKLTRAGALR
ncbi:MAG: transposase [Burkholderiales bacterium]